MEKFNISFEFENGVIKIQPSQLEDPELAFLLGEVSEIVEPVILEGSVSGKIECTIYEGRMKVNYINVMPFEAVPKLMDVLRDASIYDKRSWSFCLFREYNRVQRAKRDERRGHLNERRQELLDKVIRKKKENKGNG